jgi:acyl-coenzyme A thioesterase PaaI-like protein
MGEDALSAADELRQAVHELARKTTEIDLSTEQLRTAAEHVRIVANELTGKPSPRWGKATTRSDSQKSRTYRHRSLFQGELHPFSPTLRWGNYIGPDGELGCQFETTLSSLYEGPPAAVHGGYIAGLFDELLGATQNLSGGAAGYTAKLTIRYRSFTPTNKNLTFKGWITKSAGRRISVRATCHDDERLCSEAEALFLRPRLSESE